MKRILLAAILGGLIIFVWGAASHRFFSVGEMSLLTIPNENAVLETLKTNVPDAGIYFFPGEGMHGASDAEKAAWEETYRTGPTGLLVYRPVGGDPMQPSLLINEVLSNILCALLAAFVAASLTGSYLKRSGLLALFGIFAWVAVSISYWNWWSFPMMFILGDAIDVVIGTALAAFVIVKIVPAPVVRA